MVRPTMASTPSTVDLSRMPGCCRHYTTEQAARFCVPLSAIIFLAWSLTQWPIMLYLTIVLLVIGVACYGFLFSGIQSGRINWILSYVVFEAVCTVILGLELFALLVYIDEIDMDVVGIIVFFIVEWLTFALKIFFIYVFSRYVRHLRMLEFQRTLDVQYHPGNIAAVRFGFRPSPPTYDGTEAATIQPPPIYSRQNVDQQAGPLPSKYPILDVSSSGIATLAAVEPTSQLAQSPSQAHEPPALS